MTTCCSLLLFLRSIFCVDPRRSPSDVSIPRVKRDKRSRADWRRGRRYIRRRCFLNRWRRRLSERKLSLSLSRAATCFLLAAVTQRARERELQAQVAQTREGSISERRNDRERERRKSFVMVEREKHCSRPPPPFLSLLFSLNQFSLFTFYSVLFWYQCFFNVNGVREKFSIVLLLREEKPTEKKAKTRSLLLSRSTSACRGPVPSPSRAASSWGRGRGSARRGLRRGRKRRTRKRREELLLVPAPQQEQRRRRERQRRREPR